MNQDPNYTSLRAVLDEAYAQAATGKGKERHAGGQPFEDQPMQVISDMLGSNDGMAYQAIKKIREGLAMPDPDRTVRELLGAIVYDRAFLTPDPVPLYRRATQLFERAVALSSTPFLDHRDTLTEHSPVAEHWSDDPYTVTKGATLRIGNPAGSRSANACRCANVIRA